MNFGIVIPAHNEGDFIEKTLESLFKQTKVPSQIIVVDDCSTDSTPQILEKIKLKNPSLVILRREEGTTHLPGSKVVQAFNSGLPFLKDDIDVICKFDADLVFPPDYLDILEKHFTENQKIGMCGGFCYVERNGDWVLESLTDKDHLRGALKAYRKACFSDIGGLKTAMGWDTVDELLARFYGWEVKTDEVLKVKHLRPTGAGYNLNARFLQGSVFYRLRYGFSLSVLASAKLAFKKKKWSLFKDYLRGYFKAKREKQEFLVTPEQGKWIRHYRWNKILTKIF
ncbi:glycosyltransferase [Capnocytophaga cynodegmi]|uniref:Glycosyltransferase, group 2 family protein n=1 Tax=Capnocytophaga cynodegmi TaxID=28189 RepID=A0A0B7HD50_9FLAO|nr:glycosyltransferase family A protein [Capnocytophaga cynodegmi]CEN34928.1 Glycosyltransferase, group 2 family protein [Capnocytophaga cynodegmi]CEN35817.1 Glycosyltransferase, group 2 family protein [Capnocytophaga cynodegmi]